MNYNNREWFEVHWRLKSVEDRKYALQNWLNPDFQASLNLGRLSNIPINETQFWLHWLMYELGEVEEPKSGC